LSFALESTLKKELVIENVRAICWIVPKKYILILDQTILLHFRSSIDRPLNLPQYPCSNNYFSIPEENIHGMTWPAQSPDLNIIENLWLRIKRSLQNAAGNINTPQELFTAIQDIWMNFTVDYIKNIYTCTSIPRGILAVIRSKGYLTKY
jgi:hypothetical protein